MYTHQVYDTSVDKVYMINGVQAQPMMQQNSAPSNASTWTGNDMDSVSSADSGQQAYWETTAHMGSPQMRAQQQQQMPGQPQMYMMPDESAAQQKHDQSQDQQQRYFMPVPMVPTPFGYMPLNQPGSPMGQGSPLGSQGTPMAMPQMANTPTGMAVMQAVPTMPNGEPATPTNMQPMVSPVSPQSMMMPMANANGDGVQMMQPVTAVMIPAGMPMTGMAGMQAIQMAPPAGYMLKTVTESSPSNDQSPAGEKKPKLLEDLLPGGVRRRATREELGRKVFVGGLNPTTTTEDLRAYFSDFGAVTDSCVITDSSSKASRGFGFVEFEGKIPEGLLDQQHIIDQRRCGVREYGHSTTSP
jgi:hypothetical protein